MVNSLELQPLQNYSQNSEHMLLDTLYTIFCTVSSFAEKHVFLFYEMLI